MSTQHVDTLTGLPIDPDAWFDEGRLYMVVVGLHAYSIHHSRAAATACIKWKWERRHPGLNFEVQKI